MSGIVNLKKNNDIVVTPCLYILSKDGDMRNQYLSSEIFTILYFLWYILHMDGAQHLSSDNYRAVLTKAVLKAHELMGLSKASLARVLGISPASVTRMSGGHFLLGTDTKEWELAALLVRLYRGLDAIMAGDEAAMRGWMSSHNHDLDGRPDELIRQITGLVDCVAYVDAFRAKV